MILKVNDFCNERITCVSNDTQVSQNKLFLLSLSTGWSTEPDGEVHAVLPPAHYDIITRCSLSMSSNK